MSVIAKTEPGVVHYSLSRNTADPSIFHFFERYESKEAFEVHCSRPETQKVLSSGWVKEFKARFEKPL
jgi:quinol monooxygenase YgiN